jgi:Na+-driven multidrug efflux pump
VLSKSAIGCWASGLLLVSHLVSSISPRPGWLFTGQPAVRHGAWIALVIGAPLLPLAASAFVFDGLILGLADYSTLRTSMLIALVVFVPVAGLVDRFHCLGLAALWIGVGIWLASRTLLLRRRWNCVSAGVARPHAQAARAISTRGSNRRRADAG